MFSILRKLDVPMATVDLVSLGSFQWLVIFLPLMLPKDMKQVTFCDVLKGIFFQRGGVLDACDRVVAPGVSPAGVGLGSTGGEIEGPSEDVGTTSGSLEGVGAALRSSGVVCTLGEAGGVVGVSSAD